MVRLVHIAGGPRNSEVWTDEFVAALAAQGDLTMRERTGPLADEDIASLVRAHDVAIVGWDSHGLPSALADDPGALRYVCSYSGTIRHTVPRQLIEAGIVVSNWGPLASDGVAEGAMALLLAGLKELPRFGGAQRSGGWGIDDGRIGTLLGLRVGIYGLGYAGCRFVDLLRPFGARMMAFDPYVDEFPGDVSRAVSLLELCDFAEALVVHAGLSAETRSTLDRECLARLVDEAVVVNTARGEIFDQEALFDELESGRIRAGLDVLDPDRLDTEHPLRAADNVMFTFHQVCSSAWPERPGLSPMHQLVVDQIGRFRRGEPVLHQFDLDRFDRSS